MNYLALFFAGLFLGNAMPHLVSGLQGRPFPSPFAKPPGVGDSSPWVNFLWGSGNGLAGIILLARHPVAIGLNPYFLTLVAGFLAVGMQCSIHFGKVQRDKAAK